MTQLNSQGVEEVFILRDQQQQVKLEANVQVLQEFRYQDRHYAIVRSEDDHPDDCYLYRVAGDQLKAIEDEMEWEDVLEAIDEYWFLQYS